MPEKAEPAKKVRITLDLSPEFYARLEELEDLVGADTKANVIRQALQVFEFVALKSRDGYEFRVVAPDGSEKEIFFFLPRRVAAPCV